MAGSQYLFELKWITVAGTAFYIKYWTSILGGLPGSTQERVTKCEEHLGWSLDPALCVKLRLCSIPSTPAVPSWSQSGQTAPMENTQTQTHTHVGDWTSSGFRLFGSNGSLLKITVWVHYQSRHDHIISHLTTEAPLFSLQASFRLPVIPVHFIPVHFCWVSILPPGRPSSALWGAEVRQKNWNDVATQNLLQKDHGNKPISNGDSWPLSHRGIQWLREAQRQGCQRTRIC